ncbi:hypothetical protein [Sphingomicrobium arenosum]|uniref:hypothetical protein n=1 Tax=Sphingomicrobium arenosum TaxID=2233861 RepID=UPI002240C640|nr:hypothetical protein [Sphingomicrobium arenosum]
MRIKLTTGVLALMLAGCGGEVASDADEQGAAPAASASGDGAEASASADAASGSHEMPYGFTSYPGASDYSRWDHSRDGHVGATIDMVSADAPQQVIDHYVAAAEALGMTVHNNTMLGEDHWLTIHRADGEQALLLTVEPKNGGSQLQFGFSNLESEEAA